MATHAPTHGHPHSHAAPRGPAPALLLVEALRPLVGRLGALRVRPRLGAAQHLRPHAHLERSRSTPPPRPGLGTIGFLIGIGCFDWWWGWMLGRKVDYHDHSMHGATSWRDYFKVNTDHKVIGTQYLVVVFAFFVIGGIFAELVRAELATPGETVRRRADLQRALQRPRDADDLPVRHPGLRRPRRTTSADHDRREGHGVPAPERAVGVDAHPRRPDDGRARRSSAPSTPAGPPTRRSPSRAAPARRCSRSASRWSAPARSRPRSTSWSRSSPCARRA